MYRLESFDGQAFKTAETGKVARQSSFCRCSLVLKALLRTATMCLPPWVLDRLVHDHVVRPEYEQKWAGALPQPVSTF